MQSIINIYVDLVREKVKTSDQVPEKIRNEVQTLINADAAN
ncbi:CD1375 family protein [uncultured Brevibacillus sp.]|nr:CD1375 family protein [uncultured Brevibacillus sp.]